MRLLPSDDYNRVLLKLDLDHESDPGDDYETCSDEENEDSAKYINASLISVRPFLRLVFNQLRQLSTHEIKRSDSAAA